MMQQVENATKLRVNELQEMYNNGMNYSQVLNYMHKNKLRCCIRDLSDKFSALVHLKYSYAGIKYNDIYATKTMLNASLPNTRQQLRSAIKYQYIANHSFFDTLEDEVVLCWLVIYAFVIARNVDNNNFYVHSNGNMQYSPLVPSEIMKMSSSIIDEVCESDYSITDKDGVLLTIAHNYEYTRNKRFSREEIENAINIMGGNPSVKELCDYFNSHVTSQEITLSDLWKFTSPTLMRKYLKTYGLSDKVRRLRARKRRDN